MNDGAVSIRDGRSRDRDALYGGVGRISGGGHLCEGLSIINCESCEDLQSLWEKMERWWWGGSKDFGESGADKIAAGYVAERQEKE